MTYNAAGNLIFTPVAGTAITGLQNVNGSTNIVLTSENTTIKGQYHPCGAYNASAVAGSTSNYAIDGSINVVSNGDGTYSPAVR